MMKYKVHVPKQDYVRILPGSKVEVVSKWENHKPVERTIIEIEVPVIVILYEPIDSLNYESKPCE